MKTFEPHQAAMVGFIGGTFVSGALAGVILWATDPRTDIAKRALTYTGSVAGCATILEGHPNDTGCHFVVQEKVKRFLPMVDFTKCRDVQGVYDLSKQNKISAENEHAIHALCGLTVVPKTPEIMPAK